MSTAETNATTAVADTKEEKGQRLFDVIKARRNERSGGGRANQHPRHRQNDFGEDISPPRVFGREGELDRLKACFDRVTDPESTRSESMLIHGPSGSGKSSIVKALMGWVAKERKDVHINFASGKYDQLGNNEPFEAIVGSSTELCKNVFRAGPAITRRFNDEFKSIVRTGREAKMLSNAIPFLSELLDDSERSDQVFGSQAQAFTRFKQLWRSFLTAAVSCFHVTVLFLDDVQWADSNSIELIHSVLQEFRATNLLLICAYRDDATVQKAQAERLRWCFSQGMTNESNRNDRIMSPNNSFFMPTMDCSLQNLDWNGCNDLVMGLLYGDTADSVDDSESENDRKKVAGPLTDVIFCHTLGNAFFVLHYLDYLSVIGYLVTHDMGKTWTWDLFSIEHQGHIPDTIGQLLSKVIYTLPPKMRNLLTVAAHVGYQFSSVLLEQESLVLGVAESSAAVVAPPKDSTEPEQSALSALSSSSTSSTTRAHGRNARRASVGNALYRDRIHTILDDAVAEGLLERKSKHVYTFPHDQVQQALYMTLADRPHEQAKLHLKIGRAMLIMIEEIQKNAPEVSSGLSIGSGGQDSDTALFMAVDNLNKGAHYIDNPQEREHLIRLNYEAAQASMRKSAFAGALGYSRAAVSQLPYGHWQSIYEFSLDLYSLAARLEYSNGNNDECEALLAITQTYGRTIYDKLPSFFTEIDSLSQTGRLNAAAKLSIVVLKQLGERIPARPNLFHVVRELSKATKLIKTTREKGFLNLQPMTDPAKIAAVSVLSSLFRISYISGSKTKNLTAISMLRMVSLSCVHGLSQHTPFALAGFSSVEASMANYAGAKETSELALEMLDVVEGARTIAGRTASTIYGVVSPYAGKTLDEIHPEFLRAFHSMIAHGDMDYAYWGVFSHLSCGMVRGVPLGDLNAEYEKYFAELNEFKIDHIRHVCMGSWQLVRAMLGKKPRSTDDGDEMDVTAMYKGLENAEFNEINAATDSSIRALIKILLGTFGKDETADTNLMQRLNKYVEAIQLQFFRSLHQMVLSIGCLELLRVTGKRRFRKMAKNSSAVLEKFANSGFSPCSVAPFKLVEAETLRSVLEAKKDLPLDSVDDLETAYLDAAEAARSNGQFLMGEALAYEKLALVLDRIPQRTNKASQYHAKATALYRKWGAVAKL